MTNLRIDFFEEFPTEKNLEKAALVNFKSTVFLAARSLQELRSPEGTEEGEPRTGGRMLARPSHSYNISMILRRYTTGWGRGEG